MRHQQVIPDYVVMLESSVTVLALVGCGWLLFKLVSACIWFPQYMKNLEIEALKANEHFEERLLPKGEENPDKGKEKSEKDEGKSEKQKERSEKDEEKPVSSESAKSGVDKEKPIEPEADEKVNETSSDDTEDEPEITEDTVDEPKKDK